MSCTFMYFVYVVTLQHELINMTHVVIQRSKLCIRFRLANNNYMVHDVTITACTVYVNLSDFVTALFKGLPVK